MAISALAAMTGASAQMQSFPVASDNPAEVSFDCWVGNSGGLDTTHFIRCIADRDTLTAVAMDEVDQRFIELLDTIHKQVHLGAHGEAEKTLKANVQLARDGRVWSILLYSYPAEWSWAEGRPDTLVRASLCPPENRCKVFIRHE